MRNAVLRELARWAGIMALFAMIATGGFLLLWVTFWQAAA